MIGRRRRFLTKCLVRVGSGRVDGVLDRRLVLLDGDGGLSGAAYVVVVLGVAGWDAAGNGIVGLLVLVVGGRHGCVKVAWCGFSMR